MPHDRVGNKTYTYVLTLVDVASRYKEAELLSSKSSEEVASAVEWIYKRGPLTWPKLLIVDPGREFMGEVSHLFEKHGTMIRRGRPEIH
jgi:IS30 family transposase